ncbi:MAG: 2Fe-2S iron-sulfur cluster-binding protein, partial [Dehalobacterium sp.]
MERKIRLELNGKTFEGDISVHLTLLEFLREKMGLKGIKEGCGSGDCGACTVLLNGFPVNSCLVLAVETDGQSVTTIEGLCQDEKMSEMQQAFVAHGAVQCGYCSP